MGTVKRACILHSSDDCRFLLKQGFESKLYDVYSKFVKNNTEGYDREMQAVDAINYRNLQKVVAKVHAV